MLGLSTETTIQSKRFSYRQLDWCSLFLAKIDEQWCLYRVEFRISKRISCNHKTAVELFGEDLLERTRWMAKSAEELWNKSTPALSKRWPVYNQSETQFPDLQSSKFSFSDNCRYCTKIWIHARGTSGNVVTSCKLFWWLFLEIVCDWLGCWMATGAFVQEYPHFYTASVDRSTLFHRGLVESGLARPNRWAIRATLATFRRSSSPQSVNCQTGLQQWPRH